MGYMDCLRVCILSRLHLPAMPDGRGLHRQLFIRAEEWSTWEIMAVSATDFFLSSVFFFFFFFGCRIQFVRDCDIFLSRREIGDNRVPEIVMVPVSSLDSWGSIYIRRLKLYLELLLSRWILLSELAWLSTLNLLGITCPLLSSSSSLTDSFTGGGP